MQVEIRFVGTDNSKHELVLEKGLELNHSNHSKQGIEEGLKVHLIIQTSWFI